MSTAQGYSDHHIIKAIYNKSPFTQYIAQFCSFSILNLAYKGLLISVSRATVAFESLPYQGLRASCLAQSHPSSLCILCVKVRVWWDLLEDGHQRLSHKPPMQTLFKKQKYITYV